MKISTKINSLRKIMSELKLSSKVTLNNGVEMPIFGLGKSSN